MQVNLTFRNIDVSDDLRTYLTEKLVKINAKFISWGAAEANVTMGKERYLNVVEIGIHSKGTTIRATEKSEDMYSSIDLVLAKLERQLKKYKGRLQNHKPSVDEHEFALREDNREAI